ncbi:type-F conjugative transfer system mating-pair stabilization protein TraN [Pseudorhodoferax soli]|uniref:Conjugal transfer mating pair stabilization protein TraN n=1 Tax=Pseudorhodoferax soli TaxID=545864 RepID=A0A368XGE7_9BURK|nr:type-F conjugative transfer system mating-pair stabilization protein TraN [Pseudorhodoferax soli]RCW65084.1 conjugal transfer mating pair stabilization protein TraN [Pseudorhodoferax soli]
MHKPSKSLMQRAAVWCTLVAISITSTHADPALQAAQAAHEEGLAAGHAAQPSVRNSVRASSAQDVVPGYTATPPERSHYGQPNLSGASDAQLSACALTPFDPVCQALTGARASANIPREQVSPYDPSVLDARRVAANPASVLEDIASFYSGCEVTSLPTATTESRVCRQYSGATPQSCARTLTVDVARTSSCTPGDWIAQASQGTLSLSVQCKPDQPAAAQRMRLANRGEPLAFFDVDVETPLTFPQAVHTLADGRMVWIANNRCVGDDCQLTGLVAAPTMLVCTSEGEGSAACTEERPFLARYGSCPAGTLPGNQIMRFHEEGVTTSGTLETAACFVPDPSRNGEVGYDPTGSITGTSWRQHSLRPVTGYEINPRYGAIPQMGLRFERPHTTVTETDRWDDRCPADFGDGRCTVSAAARCVDGPATRSIEGALVTRDCWRYETALSCQFNASSDECAPLTAAGCTPSGSVCRQTNPATGQCEVLEATYACPVAPATGVAASNCPADVFCVAGSCFNTARTADTDFARAMTFLEAAREAGVYLDTDLMRVFSGERNRCRDRLLKNCCTSDSAGQGMSNQSVFGVGSRLVFDALMNSGNREFLYYGMRALLMNGGFNGTFTSYGVTVAVNGTALPAGSSVLYAGESMVVAFDPWSLVIAIVIYVVMSAISCDEEEGQLAMKEGAGLCHAVGTYCSSCIRVLGSCVSCITRTTNKCCFNSALARIVQEQGRLQIGKGWGSAQNPDCSGFTVAQLQQLDFARMDLSEFYASIVPTLPNTGTIQTDNLNRATTCYYGEGRCP